MLFFDGVLGRYGGGRVVSERQSGLLLSASDGARACAQQEPLLDLRVARPELVDNHVRMARASVRVLGDDRERAGGGDLWNGDVANSVRHLSPTRVCLLIPRR